MALARAGRPSAADAHLGVGCRAWRTTRGRLFSFGNERAAALAVPRAGAPPGEGRGSRRVKSRPSGSGDKIGRAHVLTPVTNAHLVCRLLIEQSKEHTLIQSTTTIVYSLHSPTYSNNNSL